MLDRGWVIKLSRQPSIGSWDGECAISSWDMGRLDAPNFFCYGFTKTLDELLDNLELWLCRQQIEWYQQHKWQREGLEHVLADIAVLKSRISELAPTKH